MKIEHYLEYSDYVDINLSSEDIRLIFDSEPDSLKLLLTNIDKVACFLKAVSSEKIKEMDPGQRKIVADFLTKQATRYVNPSESSDNETLEACDRWESLMASERIRFMGSARLGKDKGQVLCVEFHSDHGGDVDPKTKKETALSIERLTKYTTTMMRREPSTDL